MIKWAYLLFFTCIVSSSFSYSQNIEDFKQVEESDKKLSKLIRSNSLQYWSSMRLPFYQENFKEFLNFKGIITGDPHFGNFSILPLKNKQGQDSLEFAYIDFDDSGSAPFVFDLLRLVITTKAIEWDLRTEDKFARVKRILQAYINGLNGIALPAPSRIDVEIKKGLLNYNEKLAEFIKNKLDGKKLNKIKLVDGEIVSVNSAKSIFYKQILTLFPESKVLDIVRVLKERGGSAEAMRFLVLTQDKQKTKHLFELKERLETGLTGYEPQKNVVEWANELYPVFWPGKLKTTYDLVKLENHYFWKREKRKSLVDTPYEPVNESDLKFLEELSQYVSNHLGLIHGRQKSSVKLKLLLQNQAKQDLLQQALKESYKVYLEDALKNF